MALENDGDSIEDLDSAESFILAIYKTRMYTASNSTLALTKNIEAHMIVTFTNVAKYINSFSFQDVFKIIFDSQKTRMHMLSQSLT